MLGLVSVPRLGLGRDDANRGYARRARFGCRLVIALASLLLCLTLPVLATVASAALLVASVLVFGAAIGALDVAMNIQAIIVERASNGR